jgi:hypothetical protein
LAQQIYSKILKDKVGECTACKEDQPNQLAHYGGCFFPILDLDSILPAIRDLNFEESVALWYKAGKLVEAHNKEEQESRNF